MDTPGSRLRQTGGLDECQIESGKENAMKHANQRIALVTGANRGIGFAIAEQLARRELTVILGCRDAEKGAQARTQLVNQGLDVHDTLLDVTDATSIQAALGRIRDTFGRLDVLVNNAGIQIDGDTDILELALVMLKNTLETNAFGPLLLSQACIPLMRVNGYGRIVNISSTLGALNDMSNPESDNAAISSPAYRISKTLLNAVTVMMAKELRGSGILVNAVCPGWTRTDLGGPEAPLSPQEVADTPVWLATLPDDGPSGGFFRDRQPIPW
jgi:NAD(P)-dependent dehydrogenase (short-subunit alcohol dehydrogenase family)